ncbi:hypothetical protein Hanom_Chr05g00473521 [Helianthus anomalus]
MIQVMVWCIWRCRNNMIFKQKQANLERMKQEIRHYGYIWIRNRFKAQNLSWEQWCSMDISCMNV